MERLYIEIRFVQGTDDDFNELSDMFCGDADGFCEGNSQPVIDYLSQWDNGEIEPTTEKPRIARGDTAYADENGIYTLLYNSSVGGVFLLYRLATEREINEYYSNGKGSLSESNNMNNKQKSNNMKRKIRITESQLHNIIKESVKDVLAESQNSFVTTNRYDLVHNWGEDKDQWWTPTHQKALGKLHHFINAASKNRNLAAAFIDEFAPEILEDLMYAIDSVLDDEKNGDL